jgi:glycosyltransferase involved in cell wall biosynthesis
MQGSFRNGIAFVRFVKNRSSPVKIVHLTWGLGVGGAETMLGNIAAEQAVAHATWIIVGNRDIDASIMQSLARSVRLVTLGRPPGSANPWYLIKLILWLWWISPDIVHAHQESFAYLKRLISASMVLTVHNTRLPLSDNLTAYDSVCCISEAVREDVLSRFPECKPRVIHNGINFSAVRLKVRYGGNPFRMVQVGRLAHEQKGQDLLIRSLATVRDRTGKDIVCDFIGDGDSLPYLKRLAIDCAVEGHCRFVGVTSRQDIYDRLHEYDLLVQPSRYEGFGLTVIEGMAAGLPVLVSDIEGPMEIIADGRLGWPFRSEDTKDLASKVIELIELSRLPHFADQMRGRAEEAQGRYDIKLTAQQYLDEYARLVSGSTTMHPNA